MSNDAQKWNRLKTELTNLKLNEVDQNTLRQFVFLALPNGFVRLLFLGTRVTKLSQITDLNYVDIDPLFRSHDLTNWLTLLQPFSESNGEQVDIKQILLHERQRLSSTKGVTAYSLNTNRILFNSNNSYQYIDVNEDVSSMERVVIPKMEIQPAIIDPKLCPTNENICAYFTNGDLWLQDLTKGGEDVLQLTHESCTKVFAGFPSYCIQEEFDRYTGYYWLKNNSSKGKIVYEVVDESSVNEFVTVSPKSMASRFYKMSGHSKNLLGKNRQELPPWSDSSYPSAGSENPKVELRYLDVDMETRKVTNYTLAIPLEKQIPWVEYIVNYGWVNSKGIWAHVLNRTQDQSAVLYIPTDAFIPLEGPSEILVKPIQMIHVWSSRYWIPTTKSYHFFDPKTDDELEFIFSMTAPNHHEHLFYIKTKLSNAHAESPTVPAETLIRQITYGDYNVKLGGINVDTDNKIIYFQANADTPIENHLYSISYDNGQNEITRLTKEGFDHSNISVSIELNLYISIYSNVTTPPTCEVCRLSSQSKHPLAFLLSSSNNSTSSSISVSKKSKISGSNAQIISFNNDNGDNIYGLLYHPEDYEAGKVYPTVCYVYGGPSVQVVRNTYELQRSKRHKMYAKLGYAVIAFDNRGSAGRSLQFQGHIKGQLGQVELEDQIAGIKHVSANYGVIDPTRIAIEGWSYGGFMSLMALAKHPDIFKIAIAGAPVTDWRLYDTAYTERYLGLPEKNSIGYDKSSVLNFIDGFPDEPNRLLIFHGMIDENVLVYHTTELIDGLTAKQKPYDFKPLIQERHGLRSSTTISYYEMIVLNYLERNL